ncbi:MAG: EamA family transporter [Actinobacteria bacterium]|nr:EamA family transporter [Actinomycetota bacterium]
MSRAAPNEVRRPGASSAGIWTALGIVYVVWSTTFVAIAVVNETLPPLLATGVRFLIAGGLLLPIALRFGDREGDRPHARQWRGAAIVAALMMFGGNGGIVWAERTIPSGMAGLAIATVPLWIAAIDRVVLGRRQPVLVVVGLVVGFAGAVLLIGGNALEGEIDMGGLVLALAAAASWAAGSVYQRHAILPERPFVAAGMEMLVAAAIFFAVGTLAGELGDVDPDLFSRASLIALAYLVVIGSWVGFTSYLWLLRVARTSLVATYAYVTPVGAVLLGWLLLDESLTVSTLVAGGLIIVAVALIVSAGGARREEPGEVESERVEAIA